MRLKLSLAVLFCVVLAGCGGSGVTKQQERKQSDNVKARTEAKQISDTGNWVIKEFAEEPGTVRLAVVSVETGEEKLVIAQMPHIDWHRYKHLEGNEGEAVRFRFLRQGYREDMRNENNGDYLSPALVSEEGSRVP